MAVVFEAQGKLADVLARFKKEFLSQLTDADLTRTVSLQIRTLSEDEQPSGDEETWLKEQIIHVVEES